MNSSGCNLPSPPPWHLILFCETKSHYVAGLALSPNPPGSASQVRRLQVSYLAFHHIWSNVSGQRICLSLWFSPTILTISFHCLWFVSFLPRLPITLKILGTCWVIYLLLLSRFSLFANTRIIKQATRIKVYQNTRLGHNLDALGFIQRNNIVVKSGNQYNLAAT